MPKPVDKPCANCGQMMHGVHPGRKYCPECSDMLMRERAKKKGKYQKAKREKEQQTLAGKRQGVDSLSQMVHTLTLLNEERHLAGLPALSYGQYVRGMEGMR